MGILSARRAPDGSFEPSKLYQWLRPKTSGNTVNGLGETEIRRPRPVYHYVWIAHPWRAWQNSFYFRVSLRPRYMLQFIRAAWLRFAPLRRTAKVVSPLSPEELTSGLREHLLQAGAGDVAIAKMQAEWIMEGVECKESTVVTMAIPMDYDTMMKADEHGRDLDAGVHVIDKYNDGTAVARKGAAWLRAKGYPAFGYCGPASGKFTSIPAALAGGLGELGKHGSLIHRKFGSNFRLAYILTDAPLLSGEPADFGADEFCTRCQVCIKHCPPDAIFDVKQLVRGTEKWYVDFDKCISYFNEAFACGICLAVCPWSKPGTAESLVVKMARRRARREQEVNANG